ncbi:divergent polysaccharide deacetylase family protein [Chachezhania sediminis]|uniref:divergent polysaccharide deacetylase family protein n=1 Tax=Chachezhania sediminis TaxID=2599291 RepID=UPI00131AB064|nr:divergent polysaccharide deacetylase family protein [Chachezhania sediminis]
MRGFIGGLLVGGVGCALALSVLSVVEMERAVVEPPQMRDAAPTADVPDVSADATEGTGTATGVVPATDRMDAPGSEMSAAPDDATPPEPSSVPVDAPEVSDDAPSPAPFPAPATVSPEAPEPEAAPSDVNPQPAPPTEAETDPAPSTDTTPVEQPRVTEPADMTPPEAEATAQPDVAETKAEPTPRNLAAPPSQPVPSAPPEQAVPAETATDKGDVSPAATDGATETQSSASEADPADHAPEAAPTDRPDSAPGRNSAPDPTDGAAADPEDEAAAPRLLSSPALADTMTMPMSPVASVLPDRPEIEFPAPEMGVQANPPAPAVIPASGAGPIDDAALDPAPKPDPDTIAPTFAVADPSETGDRMNVFLPQAEDVLPLVPQVPVDGVVVPASAVDPSLKPVDRYAARFDNTDRRPAVAVVLIDDAEAAGTETLAGFPYPLTFAVDPSLPDAAERMARHRAAGFEVVALADLPDGVSAEEVDNVLSTDLAVLPETVAVMEAPGTGLQSSRAVSDRATEAVKASGRGLILQPNGLDTAQKLAAQDGVPSAVVFRDLDGDGQSLDVMRRFLDQAAGRATSEDGVILTGRIRPETISALVIWGLQDRANRVALAPVSALLKTASN